MATPGFLVWAIERMKLPFPKKGQAGYGRGREVCRGG